MIYDTDLEDDPYCLLQKDKHTLFCDINTKTKSDFLCFFRYLTISQVKILTQGTGTLLEHFFSFWASLICLKPARPILFCVRKLSSRNELASPRCDRSLSRMAFDKMGYLEKMAKNQKICHPPSTTPYVYGFKKYHLIIGLISLQIQYCLFI